MKHIKVFASILVLILLDQWSKIWAVSQLKGKDSIEIIKNIVEFQYLENRGAAFGMFQNKQIFFYVITIVVVVGLTYYYFKMPDNRRMIPLKIGYVGLFAGAVGNLIDRVMHQYVVDFIYFKWIDFPVFNLADIYVTVSIGFIAFMILFYYKEEDFSFI
ncbi:MAG: signal peptidase II [Anaerostipes sp.]|nr:signal peptidase II [Anaerostipes sp.]